MMASPSCDLKSKKTQHHVVHPISSGPVNCMITVENVIRATTDYGAPDKIPLTPPLSSFWNSKDDLLEPLEHTRHLFLRPYTKSLKSPVPMQDNRKFQILNSSGDCIFFAIEKSNVFNRLCFFRGMCPFDLKILSLNGDHVMDISGRPGFRATAMIKDSKNRLIGTIRKTARPCTPCFSLTTCDGHEILKVVGLEGSECCCLWADCGAGEDFDVNLPDGKTSIGRISCEWEYSLESSCGVFVPMKLDDRTMSLLLGAVVLIDFSFFQGRKDASCFGRCFLTALFFTLFICLLFLIARK